MSKWPYSNTDVIFVLYEYRCCFWIGARPFAGQRSGENSRLWMSFYGSGFSGFSAALSEDVIFVFCADLAYKCALFSIFRVYFLE
jgi:hypothetical protein